MEKYKNELMNYDENGCYPSEKDNITDEKKSAFIDKLTGKLFTAWFLIVIVGFIVFSRTNNGGYKIALMIVLTFVLFGIIEMITEGLKRRKLSIPYLVITICGTAGMVGLFAYHYSSDQTKSFLIRLGIFLFGMAFITTGSGIIINEVLSQRGNNKRCTFPVTAACIKSGISTATVNGREKNYYIPTYEYTFEGETYRTTISNVTQLRSAGMNYDIMIDPDKPKVAYDPDSEKSYLFSVLFGLLFVLMPLIAMIVIFIFVDF